MKEVVVNEWFFNRKRSAIVGVEQEVDNSVNINQKRRFSQILGETTTCNSL